MDEQLPYRGPEPVVMTDELEVTLFLQKYIVVILTCSATIFTLVAILTTFGDKSQNIVFWSAIFTPGYVMTAGYWWRMVGRPTLMERKFIWGFSLTVQGLWCTWFVIHICRMLWGEALSMDSLLVSALAAVFPPGSWWILTTLISLLMLLMDNHDWTRPIAPKPPAAARYAQFDGDWKRNRRL